MGILVVGLNHKTAPVEVREKIAAPEIEKRSGDIARFLSEFHQVETAKFASHLYHYYNRDAVRHLFTVGCSLDSMVVGEAEVLGQAKRAYMFALEEGVTGKVLNSLFQRAFGVAKNVRASSAIGERKVSIASVAVEFGQKIFSDFSDKTVMIIGAGEMGELTLKHLVDKGVNAVIVANRTYEKAVELARQYEGMAISFDAFVDNMHRADVVISTSGAPHYIIFPKHLPPVLRARRNKPILLIDIAVPRDIHPDVEDIDNVYLYNIDDLQKVVDENLSFREKELEHCSTIIEAETDKLMAYFETLDVAIVIKDFHEALHTIRKSELARSLNKMPNLNEKDKQEIEYLTERIVNKILNEPTQTLRKEAWQGTEYKYIEALKKLFGL
ncbi:MAG: glutamyl-tRNA reductase [Candidatus Lindowbacteria bacterium]|nr:glutamyl-tRNA reductase [Candidatus Lindowbacteria bacterium]